MAVWRRRIFVAAAAMGLSMGLAASPTALDAQAAANPITITARAGYSDIVKTGRWMPVSIAITNNGPDLQGTLEVQNLASGRQMFVWPASYERPLAIAAGASKQVRIYLSLESAAPTVAVRIVKDGRILASGEAAATRTSNTLIGVLSDESSAFDGFATVHAGQPPPDVVHLHAAELPDSAIALRAFDLLAIDDFATDGLTQGQQSAIADYVQTGGSLLIGTGATWRRTVSGLPAELLPMKLGGLTTLASSPALGGLNDVQIATGSLNGGTVWLADGDRPLLVERTTGTGSVTLATFDWKQAPIPDWAGSKALLRQVLVRTVYSTQSQQNSNLNGGPMGGQGGSLYQRSGQLSRALGDLPALDLPSLALTAGLVLVYVLLVGPVNFFALRALKRRAMAWITLPLIALLVAGGAYGSGLWAKGSSVLTNQVSILHAGSGTDRAYLETYTGVLTPTRGDYQAAVGRRPMMVSPLGSSYGWGGPGGPGGGSGDIRVNVEAGAVALPGMTAFTLRGFATESITAAPRLTGHLRLVNGQLTGSIENVSSTAFTDAVIIAGDAFAKLGPLAPGASVAIGFAPVAATAPGGGPPAILTIYPNYSFAPPQNQPSAARREGEARTQILNLLLTGGGFKGIATGPVVPMVVAWTSQSFQDVTVNGGHPRAHVQTAVALTLPLDQMGAGTVPAGLVGGRIIDVEADQQQGPPGMLSIQTGTVTLQFTPHLSAGRRLTGAAVSSSPFAAQFFGKGPSGVNSPATLHGEAWDWSRSAWVNVDYQSSAATSLPGEAVNPTTAEVRLRVTVANGAFNPAGVSLQGTVE